MDKLTRVFGLVLTSTSSLAWADEVEQIDLERWGETPSEWWSIGVAIERGDDNLVGHDLLGDQLAGVIGTFRNSDIGLGARLMMSPKFDRASLLELRLLGGLDARVYFDLFGTEWSYGLGILAEARVRDHFWLAYLSPIEFGATLFELDGLSVRLYGGIRHLFTGALIRAFLVDPNGFDSENARDALAFERNTPWEGFLRISFERRLD